MLHAAAARADGENAMEQAEVRRHKGLGIASFVVALAVLVLIFFLFLVAGVMHNAGASTPAANAIVGSGIFFLWFLDLVAVGLGIGGAVDRNSKKIFPILGIVIAAITLLLSVALVLIGIHMASQ
jgi:hypothetical protein